MESTLFSPLPLRSLVLPNRLVRAATYEGLGDEEGRPESRLANMYGTLARNDVGTIITGFCFVSKRGRAMQPRQCGMETEAQRAAWEAIVSAVKRENPRAVLIQQLAHTGRQTLERATGSRPVAPSPGASPYFRERPRVMTETDIREAIDAFAAAARRAREAGFDGVQIHAAHGYLIHQFLSPALNRRKDAWGKDRFAFLREVLGAIAEACPGFPVLLKISGADDDGGGMTPQLAGEYLRGASALGVEAAEISYGTMDWALNIFRGGVPIDRVFRYNPLFSETPKLLRSIWKRCLFPRWRRRFIPFEENYNLSLAGEIRNRTDLALILVGGIRGLGSIERMLASGACDAVSLCRPLIREPELGRLFRERRSCASQCTNCNACAVMCDSWESLRCYALQGGDGSTEGRRSGREDGDGEFEEGADHGPD